MSIPYIDGLDSLELSNTLREWFKYDGLSSKVLSIISKNRDKDDYLEGSEIPSLSESQIHRVLNIVENELREVLLPYAHDLEKSRDEVAAYIEGVMDTVARLSNTAQSRLDEDC